MILSWRHHCSLNKDHHYQYHCRCHYMQRVYVYFILSYLILPCVELTSITIVMIGMTLYEHVLHYYVISYHIISYLSWFVLHCILFNLIQLNLIWLNYIRFYSIEFDLLYCPVLYLISMNDLYLSICPSVRPCVCLSDILFICMNKFFFSLIFSFVLFSLFFSLMNVWHTCFNKCGHTHAYEYMFLLMTRKYYFKSR